MYHDVVENGDWESSGFPGQGARVYKLDAVEFRRHLDAIQNASGNRPVTLTFDDGGASSNRIAAMLEEHGWRGHFFITTNRIGEPAFVTRDQIVALRRAGHAVGSHSHTHPLRISRLPAGEIAREWSESRRILEEILGEPVRVASVPGGFYSREVARTAAAAGIETLFTSEPTARVHIVDGCKVLGRYVVQQGMGPQWSAGFAAGRLLPRLRQSLLWNLKKAAKVAGGGLYLKVRERLLSRR